MNGEAAIQKNNPLLFSTLSPANNVYVSETKPKVSNMDAMKTMDDDVPDSSFTVSFYNL